MDAKNFVLNNIGTIEVELLNGDTVKQSCIIDVTCNRILRKNILNIKMCSNYKQCEKTILDCSSCKDNGVWEVKE